MTVDLACMRIYVGSTDSDCCAKTYDVPLTTELSKRLQTMRQGGRLAFEDAEDVSMSNDTDETSSESETKSESPVSEERPVAASVLGKRKERESVPVVAPFLSMNPQWLQRYGSKKLKSSH